MADPLKPPPVAIVLAAGRGRRFAAAGGGAFKQGLPYRESGSLVAHVCDRYARAGLAVVCALHPELDELAAGLGAAGHRVVAVEDADAGMGHSLAAAVAAAATPTGWLVGLADMPGIALPTIRTVAAALQHGAPLCAPFHAGRQGHPVGFGREFGAALRALAGDRGARAIVKANDRRLVRLPVADPGVLLDIDVPDDLAPARG